MLRHTLKLSTSRKNLALQWVPNPVPYASVQGLAPPNLNKTLKKLGWRFLKLAELALKLQ